MTPIEEQRAATCDGKAAFDSWRVARKAAGRRKGRKVYRCRFCRAWHVGCEHMRQAAPEAGKGVE